MEVFATELEAALRILARLPAAGTPTSPIHPIGIQVSDKSYYTQPEGKNDEAGRYARAAVIFSVAAIEAVSNDALVAICDLLCDSWPSEHIGAPPWVHFRRLSPAHLRRLLKRGRLEIKLDYLFRRVASLGSRWLPNDDFERNLRQIVQLRNRIVHMKSLGQPKTIASILNPKQISYIAKLGVKTAKEYASLLEEAFSEMKLPIQTIQ